MLRNPHSIHQPPEPSTPVLPGDFAFKIAQEPISYDDEAPIPLLYAVLALVATAFWGAVLFFSGWSLDAKIHLFVWTLFLGALVYNQRIYRIFGGQDSPLDAYEIPAQEDDEHRGESPRFVKWLRLIYSLNEPPVPEAQDEMTEEPERNSASWRTLCEWILLSMGIAWGGERAFAYNSPNGPYFYEIFVPHCVILVLALLFWGGMWLFYRQDDDWYRRRSHTEALNFMICRWFMMYLGVWLIALMFVAD